MHLWCRLVWLVAANHGGVYVTIGDCQALARASSFALLCTSRQLTPSVLPSLPVVLASHFHSSSQALAPKKKGACGVS